MLGARTRGESFLNFKGSTRTRGVSDRLRAGTARTRGVRVGLRWSWRSHAWCVDLVTLDVRLHPVIAELELPRIPDHAVRAGGESFGEFP